MKIKSLLIFIIFTQLLLSCGKKNNTTSNPGPVIQIGNPGVAPGEGADINTRINYVLNYKACIYSTTRYQVGFKMQNYSRIQSLIFNPALNFNDSTVRVASTPENHIIIVKDYGQTQDVIVSICDHNTTIGNLASVEIYEFVPQSSNVSSCNVEQVSALNMTLFFDNGQQIPILAGPINGEGAIPGVCTRGFYDEFPSYFY